MDGTCIYNGSDSSVTVTGLSANTVYRFMSCEYNGNLGGETYKTDSETNNPVNIQTEESDIPLPISLQSFVAEFDKGSVVLNWISASETENDHYAIYRNNELLATVRGNGTTSEPHHYEFIDRTVSTGNYIYMLADISFAGEETKHTDMKRTLEINEANFLPNEFSLADAYPNPFNPITTLNYSIKEDSDVSLTIYDMTGKVVRQWDVPQQSAGWYSVVWNGKNMSGQDMSSGVYFYRLTASDFTSTKKDASFKVIKIAKKEPPVFPGFFIIPYVITKERNLKKNTNKPKVMGQCFGSCFRILIIEKMIRATTATTVKTV